jgi:hypothetical protein
MYIPLAERAQSARHSAQWFHHKYRLVTRKAQPDASILIISSLEAHFPLSKNA